MTYRISYFDVKANGFFACSSDDCEQTIRNTLASHIAQFPHLRFKLEKIELLYETPKQTRTEKDPRKKLNKIMSMLK